MTKKGLSTTLVLIVTIVVLLIVAIVLLTIFGQSLSPIATIGEAKTQCSIIFGAFCSGSGDTQPSTPSTWGANLFSVDGQSVSCSDGAACGNWETVCAKHSGSASFYLRC